MDLAKISLDLKNLAEKYYASRSVQVSSGFGEKIQDWTDQIGFWTKRPVANYQSSRVNWWLTPFWLGLPGGSGHRLSWTPPLCNTHCPNNITKTPRTICVCPLRFEILTCWAGCGNGEMVNPNYHVSCKSFSWWALWCNIGGHLWVFILLCGWLSGIRSILITISIILIE